MAKSEGRMDGAKKHKKEGKGQERSSKRILDPTPTAFSLLADETRIDPTLSSLFAARPTPPTRAPQSARRTDQANRLAPNSNGDEDADSDLGKGTETLEIEAEDTGKIDAPYEEPAEDERSSKRKRKKRDDEDELEDVYMRRLALAEAKEAEAAAAERAAKRHKAAEDTDPPTEAQDQVEDMEAGSENADEDVADDVAKADDDAAALSPPPRHETELVADLELDKASRTVFLGNVSTSAISSKSARKILEDHLKSFIPNLPEPKSGAAKHSIESIRFRSTPYASSIPKKASFARKEVMNATTRSTNAYAIYSSPTLAREAAKRLNGTIILDRHLRVDSVAHPAPADHKRCIFVGNLGFVDDESNINAANAEDGREQRKPSKTPADVEEGLWRTFWKCGVVESVRVIRDSTTRVGKGIAYVQFEDENAVEAALGYDGKKFPPMLPRKLRVSRAKAVKRNAKPGPGRLVARVNGGGSGYQRKVSGEEASRMGRAGKLFGRAGAAQVRQTGKSEAGRDGQRIANGITKPEAFVFEGHRASSKRGKPGLKLGKKKGGKPTNRSARRGAAFKSGKKK